jgi:hypothetical protein
MNCCLHVSSKGSVRELARTALRRSGVRRCWEGEMERVRQVPGRRLRDKGWRISGTRLSGKRTLPQGESRLVKADQGRNRLRRGWMDDLGHEVGERFWTIFGGVAGWGWLTRIRGRASSQPPKGGTTNGFVATGSRARFSISQALERLSIPSLFPRLL